LFQLIQVPDITSLYHHTIRKRSISLQYFAWAKGPTQKASAQIAVLGI